MDPITLALVLKGIVSIVGASAAAGTAATIIYIAIVTMSVIRHWFRTRSSLSRRNKNRLALTITQGLRHRRYGLIQGVFDSPSNSWIEWREIAYDQLDRELAAAHRHQQIICHTY